MHLYRIAHCKHITDMTGTGGLYTSGRWHTKGTRIIYFSEHISLAKLEVLVNSNFIPKNMCLLMVQLAPDITIETVKKAKLPEEWTSYPYPEELKNIAKKWLASSKSAILRVPSAQSYHEYNYLVNPLHKDITKLEIVKTEPISFDHRLEL